MRCQSLGRNTHKMKSDHHYQPQQHPGNESLGSRLGISDDDKRSSGTFSVSTAAARFLLEDLSDVTSNIPTDILQVRTKSARDPCNLQ